MEKEIAGKILSCLRESSKKVEETSGEVCFPIFSNTNENLSQNANNLLMLKNNYEVYGDKLFLQENINYCMGFSYTQYLIQSVDNLRGMNLNELEESNSKLFEEKHEENYNSNMWLKFRNFLEEYHNSEEHITELLEDLESDIASMTGIKEETNIKTAALLIFNLYLNERTSANRKEELQRIFNIKDFQNIHKVTNTTNEILKLLSKKQLTDFQIRWNEVFKDRISELEYHFKPKNAKVIENHSSSKSISQKIVKNCLKNFETKSSVDKYNLFEYITLIERLKHHNIKISAEFDENKMRNIAKLSITMMRDENIQNSSDKMYINRELNIKTITLICRVPSYFTMQELNKHEIIKMLIKKAKKILKNNQNQLESKCSLKKQNELASKHFKLNHDSTGTLNNYPPCSDLRNEIEENNKIRERAFGKNWIEKKLKNSLNRVTFESVNYKLIVLSILDLIVSNISNEELQRKLYDIFGFESNGFIETILKHRDNVKKHCKSLNKKKGVNVLSAMELNKLKKLIFEQREANDSQHKEMSSSTSLKASRSYVPESNKIYKIMDRSAKIKKTEYPNVYDSNLETKLSAGFIFGTKILLPENHIRKDTKMYEEVLIPISVNLIHDIPDERINVSSLDKIGKIAFDGIQSLNRIQSIVFNTAYHSNENLLICAPTGAGKTNIALLTIVHEIKQNIENGVIEKDKFKIIYIAPMKALAAEMTRNFSSRLKNLGIIVKELTGDMQLSKHEISKTQLLVTTPEKWDLVTRKGDGDTTLSSLVKLLIIDEVHLLHSDRGPVIEALVARTLRQVETSQKMIRIVGLSATLPNYKDVAVFLKVNLHVGLFYFDSRFRPVPLSQCFVGVKAKKPVLQIQEMNQVCYDKVFQAIKNGMQVMVFVHARNATAKTATVLKEIAQEKGHQSYFEVKEENGGGYAKKLFQRAKSKQLLELLQYGFSIHHAGLLRYDRTLVEDCFSKGLTRVLVCTSTLAWGVNLPAHAVIIKGTEIYDSKHGSFVDIGILDVLQIFGRAGRPQYNESGHGVIITSHNKLHHYLSLMMNQFPIESRFNSHLADNLNAEITLGTITCIEEAIEWLSYTYLFVRMRINPQEYGLNYTDVENDYPLFGKRKELIVHTAKLLDKLQMIRYNEEIGKLSPTDLGRTASLFYVKHDTIEIFNSLLRPVMNEVETLNMLSQAQEFQQLKVRDDEIDELNQLEKEYCEYPAAGGSENIHGKVNILLQTFLSRGRVKSFSLISDLAYISQNASRIMRALFDIFLRKNNPIMAGRFLQISQMFERQQWYFETPLRQFIMLPHDIINKIEQHDIDVDRLKEMESKEIGIFLRHAKMGGIVKKCVCEFPSLELVANIQPITRTVLRVRLHIKADFVWNDKIHGRNAEPFWVWVEDPETNFMYHSEYFFMTRKQVIKREMQELVFTIPVHEPLPSQYVVRIPSDRWLCSVSQIAISLNNIILPELHPIQTELLPLQPLPVSALKCPEYESLYKFTHFNPIQTQIFHCLYYTDNNVLLGAPTGSGKTIVAEIGFLRVFKQYPDAKVVYIAPLKALVKERIRDWKVRFEKKLKKKVVELTGDVTPDIQAIQSASIIVTTPEKWDSISRSWQTRNYVQKVVLIVIDEIHLLGEDRGPVLEIIVSRTNFIVSHTGRTIRIIGLSTALANAQDLANWLRIGESGMYNFRPSVRPVPLEVHISAFPGKYYCPRMASMNKPAFQAIKQYSPSQPVLIFVSSRRQTRLTAMDLLAHLASESNPKQWLRLKDHKMNKTLETVKDDNLKMVLAFGIGIHHAGLQENDRRIVEELFEHQHIQVLVATSTLAWGVNFPAHLVIIKGTEYYDCKSHRYVDMPITDILQMMGRAGRPQFDKQGIAVVMVHDVKKNFYKKFLYEPFPVESNLLAVLPDHLNAEIVASTLTTCQDATDYLTWTYFFRRLLENPTFYSIQSLSPEDINNYLTNLISAAVLTLENSQCLIIDGDGRTLIPTSFGRISSFYYVSHQTMLHFRNTLRPELSMEDLINILSHAHEYNEIPVRHNEEITNSELAKFCPIQVDPLTYDSPHTKTHLLFQSHFSRLVLPCTDYQTDLKSVLDQSVRILQAMIDVCGERGWLISTLRAQQLFQMLVQGRWITDHPISTLPYIEKRHMYLFTKNSASPLSLPTLCKLVYKKYGEILNLLQREFNETQINKIYEVIYNLPKIQVELSISESIKEKQFLNEDDEIQITTTKINTNEPVTVKANREYVLHVKLVQLNKRPDLKVHAPKFSKSKDESWFLTFGVIRSKELLILKRLTFGRRKTVYHNLIYRVPNIIGEEIISVYLMSDSYIGLDQQYNIKLSVIP